MISSSSSASAPAKSSVTVTLSPPFACGSRLVSIALVVTATVSSRAPARTAASAARAAPEAPGPLSAVIGSSGSGVSGATGRTGVAVAASAAGCLRRQSRPPAYAKPAVAVSAAKPSGAAELEWPRAGCDAACGEDVAGGGVTLSSDFAGGGAGRGVTGAASGRRSFQPG